jgi:hypothetical protein
MLRKNVMFLKLIKVLPFVPLLHLVEFQTIIFLLLPLQPCGQVGIYSELIKYFLHFIYFFCYICIKSIADGSTSDSVTTTVLACANMVTPTIIQDLYSIDYQNSTVTQSNNSQVSIYWLLCCYVLIVHIGCSRSFN